MTRRAAALLLTAVLVVPACTTRTGGAAPATSGTASSPTTTTTSATTAPPAPTAAADGGNVAACRDGACEVRLTGRTVIPVAPAAGITELAVESITGDEVSTALTLAGNTFDMNCEGDERCQTSFVGTTPPVGFVVAHPGARVTINRLVVEIPAAADGTAILRLSRR
ncbi:hypothetical protein [Actinophytocola sp.]|uniref:hypothetical protein n=1 Tax=Actinophytocola sp. TaxID=1872138 RepID=UPI003D6B2D27